VVRRFLCPVYAVHFARINHHRCRPRLRLQLCQRFRPTYHAVLGKVLYPAQKPLALLGRIIKASSNSNDIVPGAFCGCGRHSRQPSGLAGSGSVSTCLRRRAG